MALFRLLMTAAREARDLIQAVALTAVAQALTLEAALTAAEVQSPARAAESMSSQLGTDEHGFVNPCLKK